MEIISGGIIRRLIIIIITKIISTSHVLLISKVVHQIALTIGMLKRFQHRVQQEAMIVGLTITESPTTIIIMIVHQGKTYHALEITTTSIIETILVIDGVIRVAKGRLMM